MIIGISGRIGSGKNTVGKIIQYLEFQEAIRSGSSYIPSDDKGFENFCKAPIMFDWQIKKFTYKLKQICSLLTGIPVEDFEKQEVKDRLLGEEWTRIPDISDYHSKYKLLGGYGVLIGSESQFILDKEKEIRKHLNKWESEYKHPTVRRLLQTVGTEAMRDTIHENVWVNALFADYKDTITYLRATPSGGKTAIMNFPNWVVTDMRFPNELKAIEDRDGITIRVNREDLYFYMGDYLTWESFSNILYKDTGKYPIKEKCKNVLEHPSETSLDNANFNYIIDNNGTIEELVEKVKKNIN